MWTESEFTAEWRSASTNSGARCVTTAGTWQKPASPAHNWVLSTVSVASYSYSGLCLAFDSFAVANPFTEYGGGSGRIHSFSCAGNENGLLNCSSDLDVDYCYHFKDVGVLCYYGSFIDLRYHNI